LRESPGPGTERLRRSPISCSLHDVRWLHARIVACALPGRQRRAAAAPTVAQPFPSRRSV
jgi:hypothetical protein